MISAVLNLPPCLFVVEVELQIPKVFGLSIARGEILIFTSRIQKCAVTC
jgi:hypothetical protein